MFDLNNNQLKAKYETGVANVKTAVETSKDITVRPKFDMGLEINSKKQRKSLFSFDFHFDKEFSLFDVILTAVAVIAAIGAVTTAIDVLRDKCKCRKNSEIED